jgi:hypothetical protein
MSSTVRHVIILQISCFTLSLPQITSSEFAARDHERRIKHDKEEEAARTFELQKLAELKVGRQCGLSSVF